MARTRGETDGSEKKREEVGQERNEGKRYECVVDGKVERMKEWLLLKYHRTRAPNQHFGHSKGACEKPNCSKVD